MLCTFYSNRYMHPRPIAHTSNASWKKLLENKERKPQRISTE